MTDDPGGADDLPFADPADEQPEPSSPAPLGAAPPLGPPIDADRDGTLDPHEDRGQAGNAPDEGPAIGPDGHQ